MKQIIHNEWQEILQEEFQAPYYQQLRMFLKQEYEEQTIYPVMQDIWQAFELTPYNDVKVLILGQDPYHGPNQAHGLSFSVQKGVKIPPSLRNIYKELEEDLGIKPANHGDLTSWAKQGIFLLNTVLTVRQGQAYSHRGKGWEMLTDAVIRALNNRKEPVIFLLWGNASIAKKALIDTQKHIVLTSPHPSPLSAHRGFFGSKPFSKINDALIDLGEEPIDWQLPEEE
ncbi:uracil-DNA glycosylase [Jeotgalibaca ciconiae]|uniref:Uracil-DNA glycosylase n=1 Tax=Jeotgalibaca ciconiae TaxID=2496265 RepID=A0A3Q9BKL1_9LACT|nr:uracil-DNA glycosylase [Jeotgalibaca ciconiae]AZP03410.1 uracil-DNA glycosylase [Jeotgalibaca ciconiae]